MGCGPSSETEVTKDEHDSLRKLKATNSFTGTPTITPVDLSEMTLTQYLECEREIAEAEASNPIKPLDLKADQLVQLQEEIEMLETRLKSVEEKTSSSAKTHSDDVETHNYFLLNGIEDDLTPEQQSHLDLLNEKEIIRKELKSTKRQYKKVSQEVGVLQGKAEKLQGLYKKQDDILSRIFGGQYGSLAENQLEKELDHLESLRGKILEANFKWRQGQMMLEYACKQLAVAVQKWQNLPEIPTIDLEVRYRIAAESRNNLVAAGQNISGAQRYLEKVDFPYCSPNEVDTLNKAAQYVFTDMQSKERHGHAQECYETSHQRANALLQWFGTVINKTIMEDLHEVNERVKVKTLDLRRERVRLIKLKMKEMYGTDLELDQSISGRDVTTNEIAHALLSDNQVVKVEDSGSKGVSTPPMLSTEELAPMPSNTIIFGNMYDNYKDQVESLSKQHHEELQTFMKEQEQNQQRIKGDLEEKLVARRQRRARVKMEETQKTVLRA